VEAKASDGAMLDGAGGPGGGGRGGAAPGWWRTGRCWTRGGGGWGDCRRSPAGRRMSSTGGSSGADLKICWG
jgi:hypothetical protein